MTARRGTPRAPAGLDAAGRALWRSLWKVYEFEPWETPIVEQAARLSDVAARLAEHLETHGLHTAGSMGQTRLDPAVAELRQTRATIARLLAGLNLPPEPAQSVAGEDAGNVAGPAPTALQRAASRRAAKAAEKRWTGTTARPRGKHA